MGKGVEKINPCTKWWIYKLVQALWKILCTFLKKLKIKDQRPQDLAISPLDIYPKEIRSIYGTDIFTLMFIAVLFIISKILKQSECPFTDNWIKILSRKLFKNKVY